jgi:hypothetical protein
VLALLRDKADEPEAAAIRAASKPLSKVPSVQTIYSSAVSAVTSPTDLRGILRAYLEGALEDDSTMRLSARPGRPVYGGLLD